LTSRVADAIIISVEKIMIHPMFRQNSQENDRHEECIGDKIDRAMDAMDLQRDFEDGL